jgi:hypothetical protein
MRFAHQASSFLPARARVDVDLSAGGRGSRARRPADADRRERSLPLPPAVRKEIKRSILLTGAKRF